jgi:L-fuculose-phosphate aldolase
MKSTLIQADIYQAIKYIAERLYQRNLLAAADGNISYRMDNGYIAITASGIAKVAIQPDELAIIKLNGEVISGNPSSEKLMHCAVYQKCPTARWVIHAHPPTAIAWTVAKPELSELPGNCISELILAAGKIPIVPYARPGTAAMGENLIPFLPTYRILLLARHGALAWGENWQEALNGMERLEHAAQILLHAEKLGGITDLPSEEIAILQEMRIKIGNKTI